MGDTNYADVLRSLAPEDRERVIASAMRMRIYGGVSGVGCHGVGSWLSSLVRSVAQPIANIVAPATPVTAAINTLFPQAALPAPPAQATATPATSYAPLVWAGLGLAALFVLKGKR